MSTELRTTTQKTTRGLAFAMIVDTLMCMKRCNPPCEANRAKAVQKSPRGLSERHGRHTARKWTLEELQAYFPILHALCYLA
eukprot:m.107886 g.107886  ORF g.107886 m.107886 type:complete len:82 (+) comp12779_c0_seq1:881-1126(+)